MSAHSLASQAHVCICGQRMLFQDYHWPHCKLNPNNLAPSVVKNLPFTKGELAKIAMHGPQADQHTSKRRKGGRV